MNLPLPTSSGGSDTTILKLTGSHSTIEFEPLPVDDPVRRWPDIGLAKRALEWSPWPRRRCPRAPLRRQGND